VALGELPGPKQGWEITVEMTPALHYVQDTLTTAIHLEAPQASDRPPMFLRFFYVGPSGNWLPKAASHFHFLDVFPARHFPNLSSQPQGKSVIVWRTLLELGKAHNHRGAAYLVQTPAVTQSAVLR
jgi:hypothetical protein